MVTRQTLTQLLFMCLGGGGRGGGERRLGVRLRRAQGIMGREEGKIATGKFRSNMAAREESSLSRDVNNALNEGKLACQHSSCTVNNIFVTTTAYPVASFRVKFSDNYLL